ncbi:MULTISPECIES: CRISPR-associated endonuclease Cas1 [Leptolyngbya]|uniref:CRISPR-associated endonuclease Cas1 n=1 Tax=Leptolyngbya TaxID=47251 RepID=UPI0016839C96|nr:CRISPR-associated endonuclease Cas1 [Leptolyngbya sp. FACHB-1624]MBD1856197.1 CRISPR-associated endonuclease Cas1 [Leptolyngbya sp. FACHB-1624]
MLDWERFLSSENFGVAWEKVRSNHGCAGVDGETIEQFERAAERNLEQLRRAVMTGRYQAMPLKSFQVPKKAKLTIGEAPKTEWRGLSVPTVRDRIVQQALLNLLHPVLEAEFEDCSFAYRPGRSYKAAVRQVQQWQQRGYDHVLDADVVKYFNNVQHQRLLREFRERVQDSKAETLIAQWMKSGVQTASGLVLPQKGIPQGSVVSPILANVYFDDFDEVILESGLKLVRFADDFVILAKSKARIEYAQRLVQELLIDMGLELHPDKTRITNFNQGFHFLGHTFVRSLIVEDEHPKRKKKERSAKVESTEAIVRYEDPPMQMTQMQQALIEAVRGAEKPIPPPLYVVLGYKVRDEKRVEIQSQELEWKAGMSTLYLVQQGAMLRKEQGRFVVQPPAGNMRSTEIPIREVERVLVLGNIQVSTAALAVCLEEQIPLVFLTQLGDYKGHVWSAEFCDLAVEGAQFGRRHDPGFQLGMARQIVRGKLLNSKVLLMRLGRRRKVEGLAAKIARMEQHIQAVEWVRDLEVLRGYEGAGAALYFGAFGQLITNGGFEFRDRNRRPPKDPVNSLLSFGYTLLFNNVMSLILAEGLNPYLGNLHRSDRKLPHLAFDLMEEWRSVIVDSLVLTLVNKKILKPTDFSWTTAEGGVFLTDAARRVFLREFEERISSEMSHPAVQEKVSYRRAIQLQVQQYKRCLLHSEKYQAFVRPNH